MTDQENSQEVAVDSVESLVRSIQLVHEHLTRQAAKAVNVSLTVRNWLIGLYIAEYEQQGADRAKYGDELLKTLAKKLKAADVCRTDVRELRRFRQFYQTYPQIRGTLSPDFRKLLPVKALVADSSTRVTVSPVSATQRDRCIRRVPS